MKWLANDDREITEKNTIPKRGEMLGETMEWRRLYRADKVVGPPRATPTHTVEELEARGMIGLYSVEDE